MDAGPRFIAAYNDIEAHFRAKLGRDEHVEFAQLEADYRRRFKLTPAQHNALIAYAALRNAISHGRYYDGPADRRTRPSRSRGDRAPTRSTPPAAPGHHRSGHDEEWPPSRQMTLSLSHSTTCASTTTHSSPCTTTGSTSACLPQMPSPAGWPTK